MNQINTSILDLATFNQMKNPSNTTLIEQLSYLINTAKLTIEYISVSIGFSIKKIAKVINSESKDNQIFSVLADGKLSNDKPIDLEKAKLLSDHLIQDYFQNVQITLCNPS
jgi:hypothetical protein